MQRTALALTSLGVAALACVAVMYALRERPGPGPAVQRAAEPALAEPTGAPRSAPPEREAPAGRGARDEERFLSDLARASEAEEQALRDSVLRVGEDDSLTLDARLLRYREAVQAARAEAPGSGDTFEHPGMLAEVFLRMESVQRELAALSPAARSRELAHIRRELGYGEEEIARMEHVDERREARWQNGLAYMQERARIEASFEGDALQGELRALREEYFADEAPTIEAEERDGFFRFQRPRVYGRN